MTAALAVLAAAVGLALGSFANVVIHRLPADRSVVWPGSHCPSCRAPVRPLDNIPVVSWLWLRARCRACAAPISVRYPLVELLCGLLAWLTWRRFVPSGVPDAGSALAWLGFTGFAVSLVIASLIDVRHRLLPNETTVASIPVGIGLALALQALDYQGWGRVSWHQAVLGAAVGGASFGVIAWTARRVTGREALGFGDVKFVAALGAWVGLFPGLLFVVQLGSILGSIVGIGQWALAGRRSLLPFGPSLGAAALLWILYGDHIVRAVLPTWSRWLPG